MRKNILYLSLLVFISSNARAVEEFGNVKFSMTRKQVEERGYTCGKSRVSEALICRNPNLRNRVLGYLASNYSVFFESGEHISYISADMGIDTMEDYIALRQRAAIEYPISDERYDLNSEGVIRHFQRNDKRGAVSVMIFSGVPGIKKTNISLSYYSPSTMIASDKNWDERNVGERTNRSSDVDSSK